MTKDEKNRLEKVNQWLMETADQWEDGTLGQSPEHAKPAPQELQDKINASLKEGK